MSVLVSLSVKARPENAEELRNWFKEEIHHSRGFDGCNEITVYVDQDDPNHLFVLGNWDSREQHEKYVSWRAETGDVQKFVGWLADAPAAHYFDGVDM